MIATRRLAAILVADVVGFARLLAAGETGTLVALKERRKAILEPLVKENGGRRRMSSRREGPGFRILCASCYPTPCPGPSTYSSRPPDGACRW
jgi:class 3 adenylate cyclase